MIGALWLGLLVPLLYCRLTLALDAPQIPLATGKDGSKQPNIIFVMTDDQDLHMDSLSYMPHLRNHITAKGASFTRHYCTVALCCPSRVSLWTGKAAHNTNVTDINPPYGGYPKFVSQGFISAYLPLWLQSAGYATYYVGKLFNAQSVENYDKPHAAGWTGSEFLLDPYTYEYLNATFQRNHEPPVSYEGQYSTDVLAQKSFAFLEDAVSDYKANETRFFLTIAPTAPHSNVHMNTAIDGNFSEGSNTQSPPIPAERHKNLFADVKVPRAPHFNPSNPHGVSWICRLPHQNQTNVDFNDHFYRQRLRALQAVDEIIDELFKKLEDAGILEETYVFFSTDNGYHIGQHRLQPGKQCPFEEDVNIPFMVRGPGIAKNHTTDIVTTHTDLAPTFLALAGAELRDDFDGAVIPLHRLDADFGSDVSQDENTLQANEASLRKEHVNIESWGVIMSEGDYGSVLYPNHTYKALRIIAPGYSLLYTVWCSGEHELYSLLHDPYEMENLYASANHSETMVFLGGTSGRDFAPMQEVEAIPVPEEELAYRAEIEDTLEQELEGSPGPQCSGRLWCQYAVCTSLDHLVPRLDALLMVLKTCKGKDCVYPWKVLHPDGDVDTLMKAMNPKFDEFYVSQQRVAFKKCEKGYILESEGPVEVTPYTFDDGS